MGVAIPFRNALLSNRLFIYDGGQVDRPFEFATEEEAKAYAERTINSKPRILFSRNDIHEYKAQIKAIEKDKNTMNP